MASAVPPTGAENAETLVKVKDAAANADVVIAVMGEVAGIDGESR